MVQLIQWNDQLEIGHAEIDAEHRTLIGLMNQALEALLRGSTDEDLPRIFAALVAYANTHFSNEEAVMQEADYPDQAAHIREHLAFREQLNAFLVRYEAGETQLTLGVMKFLRNWLTGHILTVDRRLADYLRP